MSKTKAFLWLLLLGLVAYFLAFMSLRSLDDPVERPLGQQEPALRVIPAQDRVAKVSRSRDRPVKAPSRPSEPRTDDPVGITPTSAPKPSTALTGPSEGIPAVLACIRQHESGGNYQAVNQSSGASGAYQLLPEYADDWAQRYGYEDWASVPVIGWPKHVQDSVALGLFRDTNGGAWFDFTSYTC